MAEEPRARRIGTDVLFAIGGLLFLCAFAPGFWMLNQVLDAAIFLGREYVTAPLLGQTDVWTYHDFAYLLLWGSYLGLSTIAAAPRARGNLDNGRIAAMLLGFVLLTAGLWIAQDGMKRQFGQREVLCRPPVLSVEARSLSDQGCGEPSRSCWIPFVLRCSSPWHPAKAGKLFSGAVPVGFLGALGRHFKEIE